MSEAPIQHAIDLLVQAVSGLDDIGDIYARVREATDLLRQVQARDIEQTPIMWRRSVSDLATDIRGTLTPSEVDSLCKLLGTDPEQLREQRERAQGLRFILRRASPSAMLRDETKDKLAQEGVGMVIWRLLRVVEALNLPSGAACDDLRLVGEAIKIRSDRDTMAKDNDCGRSTEDDRCRSCAACARQMSLAYLTERNEARAHAYNAVKRADELQLTLRATGVALDRLADTPDSEFWRNVAAQLQRASLPTSWQNRLTPNSDYATLASYLGAAIAMLRHTNTCAACQSALLEPDALGEPPHCLDCHPDEEQEQAWLDKARKIRTSLEGSGV